MADKPARDKPKATPPRRARGFARAGSMITAQMQTVSARRGFALARLCALWPDIAGAELAAICHPQRLSLARGPAGGLLTLAVAPGHGPELQMQVPVLCERVNAALGPGAVGRIQLVQPAGRLPAPPPVRRPPPPAPIGLGSLAAPVSTIGDEHLRLALETLARNVLSRALQNARSDQNT